MRRRTFLRTAALTAGLPLAARAAVASAPLGAAASQPEVQGEALPVFDAAWPTRTTEDTLPAGLSTALAAQVRGYMQASNAPGVTFALTDLAGHRFTAAFGYDELATRTPLTPDRRFQIGSISKSMATLLILQLVEEGKLELDRPVLAYLPWLPWETPYGAVTLHHVLTHTTGLPNGGPLFFDNNAWVHKQAYAPGKRFYYSNMAFDTLRYLVELCDGRDYQASLVARLLGPLGMRATRPLIGGPAWLAQAVSYTSAIPGRPYTRFAPLRQAAPVYLDESAGCVASTAGDMAIYARFLARGGVTDSGARLVGLQSFAQMTTPHIPAPEFGPTASYGYGIAVDTVNGDTILLHTGGMVSFASSIYINRTRGIGGFASINAMQGYRPTPATRHAVEALAAALSLGPTPAAITVPGDRTVPHPEQFTGRYTGDGLTLTVAAQDGALRLQSHGQDYPLEGEDDSFDIPGPQPPASAAAAAMSWVFERDSAGKVIGLHHGPAWYPREGAPPPAPSQTPPVRNTRFLTGMYVNNDPWEGAVFVFERLGRLYCNDTELIPRDDGSFTLAVEPGCPDRVGFRCMVGQARILLFNGIPYRRFTSFDEGSA